MVGGGLLTRCGELLRPVIGPCRAAVITDDTVAPLYLEAVTKSLESAGFGVCSFAFPAGEDSKNMRTLSDILEFLAAQRMTRADCVVALGGGVPGDVAGFAAGCYMRGIRIVQLPTTLLAAVDSSVGGKTGVDLAAGKNLAGLFLQPSAVICDTDCLNTLPPQTLADGAAEAVKTAILSGGELFSLVEHGISDESLPRVIELCARYKAGVVEADEFERGPRKLLNLGHTAGHAVEKCSGYAVTHGHAVAIGTAIISRAAARLGWCTTDCARRIIAALEANALPVSTDISAKSLSEAALADKKRSGAGITLVVPHEIGSCVLRETDMGELTEIIAAGMEDL